MGYGFVCGSVRAWLLGAAALAGDWQIAEIPIDSGGIIEAMNRRKWRFSAFGGFMATLGLRKAAPAPARLINAETGEFGPWLMAESKRAWVSNYDDSAHRTAWLRYSGKWSPE